MSHPSLKVLCVSRYFKGEDFIRSSKASGNEVYLLTSTHLKSEPWPWESLDEVFYAEEDENKNWNLDHVIKGLAYKFRSIRFDRFVSLDDFDVENTALLREHFRMPGMGESQSRFFRDKLAMRMQAQAKGVAVPAFTSLFHDADIRAFAEEVPPPWLIKPRSAASARGIRKIHDAHNLWISINELGDQRHHYLLEKFAPGTVFHVDGLSFNGELLFSHASEYLDTPLEVSQGGGIFRSRTLDQENGDGKALNELNARLLAAMGMPDGASHTEFIKDRETGEFFFLETSCRVGGANLAEMVQASTGINLWAEWAKIDNAAALGETYHLPKVIHQYAGIVISLSRFEKPDASSFNDPEIWWRINKDWHIGMIVCSPNHGRVGELLDDYTRRIGEHFHASLPPMEEPRH